MRRLWFFSLFLVFASGWALGFAWGDGSVWMYLFAMTTVVACAELAWSDWLIRSERLFNSSGGPGGEKAGEPDD